MSGLMMVYDCGHENACVCVCVSVCLCVCLCNHENEYAWLYKHTHLPVTKSCMFMRALGHPSIYHYPSELHCLVSQAQGSMYIRDGESHRLSLPEYPLFMEQPRPSSCPALISQAFLSEAIL